MKAERLGWTKDGGWTIAPGWPRADLVLYFGSRDGLASGDRYHELTGLFPGAHIVGCSTGGQIRGLEIVDDEIAGVAISFEATTLKVVAEPIEDARLSLRCGGKIGKALDAPDLAGIFVLSDGLRVNGSELVSGINDAVGTNVILTGGLAGDGPRFEDTLVGADCPPRSC